MNPRATVQTSPSYSITLRVRIEDQPRMFARIASVIDEDTLSADCIIPSVFDKRVAKAVAKAVARAAIDTGVARRAHTARNE